MRKQADDLTVHAAIELSAKLITTAVHSTVLRNMPTLKLIGVAYVAGLHIAIAALLLFV